MNHDQCMHGHFMSVEKDRNNFDLCSFVPPHPCKIYEAKERDLMSFDSIILQLKYKCNNDL